GGLPHADAVPRQPHWPDVGRGRTAAPADDLLLLPAATGHPHRQLGRHPPRVERRPTPAALPHAGGPLRPRPARLRRRPVDVRPPRPAGPAVTRGGRFAIGRFPWLWPGSPDRATGLDRRS